MVVFVCVKSMSLVCMKCYYLTEDEIKLVKKNNY